MSITKNLNTISLGNGFVKNEYKFNSDVIEKVLGMSEEDFASAWNDLQIKIGIVDLFRISGKNMFTEICGYSLPVDGSSNMINYSGEIGEDWKAIFAKYSNGNYMPHPIPNGYPDLCDTSTPEYKKYYQEIINGNIPASEFCYGYKYGGKEIKACKAKWGKNGALLAPSPEAHHAENTNVLVVLWDFDKSGQKRKLLAAFYTDGLTKEDWGGFILPEFDNGKGKKYSSRITPHFNLKKTGRNKLLKNCLCYLNDEDFEEKLNCIVRKAV